MNSLKGQLNTRAEHFEGQAVAAQGLVGKVVQRISAKLRPYLLAATVVLGGTAGAGCDPYPTLSPNIKACSTGSDCDETAECIRGLCFRKECESDNDCNKPETFFGAVNAVCTELNEGKFCKRQKDQEQTQERKVETTPEEATLVDGGEPNPETDPEGEVPKEQRLEQTQEITVEANPEEATLVDGGEPNPETDPEGEVTKEQQLEQTQEITVEANPEKVVLANCEFTASGISKARISESNGSVFAAMETTKPTNSVSIITTQGTVNIATTENSVILVEIDPDNCSIKQQAKVEKANLKFGSITVSQDHVIISFDEKNAKETATIVRLEKSDFTKMLEKLLNLSAQAERLIDVKCLNSSNDCRLVVEVQDANGNNVSRIFTLDPSNLNLSLIFENLSGLSTRTLEFMPDSIDTIVTSATKFSGAGCTIGNSSFNGGNDTYVHTKTLGPNNQCTMAALAIHSQPSTVESSIKVGSYDYLVVKELGSGKIFIYRIDNQTGAKSDITPTNFGNVTNVGGFCLDGNNLRLPVYQNGISVNMTINTTSGTVTSINPNPLPTSFTGDTETQCKNASGGIFRTFFNKVLGRFGLRKN